MGLGEALVGNFPGSALRAVVSKAALQQLLQQAAAAGSPADAGVRHLSCWWMRPSERTLLPAELVLRFFGCDCGSLQGRLMRNCLPMERSPCSISQC